MDGNTYKRLRSVLGLTVPQLAEKLEISAEYISAMERGKRPITEKQEQALCNLILEVLRTDDPAFAKLSELMDLVKQEKIAKAN